LINIDASAISFNAFNISSSNNVIKGLVIKNVNSPYGGVSIYSAAAHHNLIAGNYIGVTESGNSAAPNAFGVLILDGAHDNNVGGTTPATAISFLQHV